MDRNGNAAVPTVPPGDVEPEADAHGWDAHAVWEARVRRPRATVPSTTTTRRKFIVEEAGAGWDPLRTWQLRVRRAPTDRER